MASKKSKSHLHSRSFIILIIAFFVLTTGLVINMVVTGYLLKKDQQQANQQIANLILDAINGLNRPLVKDPSGKQFIPEARLSLPATDSSLGPLVYNYMSTGNEIDERLQIASETSIRLASQPLRNAGQKTVKSTFESVPRLQACARGVQVTFTPETGQTHQATKKLANGKTAYLYMEDACKNDKLWELITKLESY